METKEKKQRIISYIKKNLNADLASALEIANESNDQTMVKFIKQILDTNPNQKSLTP